MMRTRSLSTGRRLHYGEVLRRAREQSLLTLAATNAMIVKHDVRSASSCNTDVARIEHEIDQLVADQESTTLVAIGDALRVLSEAPELYGVCDVCGQAISLERLNVRPWTGRCDVHADELPWDQGLA